MFGQMVLTVILSIIILASMAFMGDYEHLRKTTSQANEATARYIMSLSQEERNGLHEMFYPTFFEEEFTRRYQKSTSALTIEFESFHTNPPLGQVVVTDTITFMTHNIQVNATDSVYAR